MATNPYSPDEETVYWALAKLGEVSPPQLLALLRFLHSRVSERPPWGEYPEGLLPPPPFEYMLLEWMVSLGWLDYGVSIRGCWPSELGLEVLAFANKWGDDPEEWPCPSGT